MKTLLHEGSRMSEQVIGAVDIGGTKIMVGIADCKGHIACSQSFPTQLGDSGAENSLVQIVELLNKQRAQNFRETQNLSGIGVVCAGPIDTKQGIVQNPYTLPGWEAFPLSRRLSEETGVPVLMENDANGALLGEVTLRGLIEKRVLMVTVGTGIGVACMNRGKLYKTGEGYHPEMGHIVISSQGDKCYCGQTGCFESLCSGTAVNKRAEKMGFHDFDELFQYSKSGDIKAKEGFWHITDDFSRGLWNLCVIFKPEVVILGGGLMEKYYVPFSERFLEFTKGQEDFVGQLCVVQAKTQAGSALVGAAQLVSE
ncbi:MAG: ROK family protein [Lachnospiraceae bacterium]|nr:ROK family protein [Lachnospiraceae bacterium]